MIMKLFLRCFLIVVLVGAVCPEITFAADQGATASINANAPNTQFDQIKDSMSVEALSDISKKTLGYLLGGAGGLFGDKEDVSALGYVLGSANIPALFVGVFILGYVLIFGTVNTAASGEIIGRQWSSVYVPLRIVAAFGLCTTTPLTEPYSPVQYIPMQAYVFGDNFATFVAKELNSKLINRDVRLAGAVPMPPATLVNDLAGSAYCADNEYENRTVGRTENLNTIPLYSLKVKDDNGLVSNVKVMGPPSASSYKYANDGTVVGVEFGSTGLCGSLDLSYGGAIKSIPVVGSGLDTSESKAAYRAVNAVIFDYLNYFTASEVSLREANITSVDLQRYYDAGSGAMEQYNRDFIKKMEDEIAVQISKFPSSLKAAVESGYKPRDAKSFSANTIKHWTDINTAMLKLSLYSSAPNMAMQTVIGSLKNTGWRNCFANADDCDKQIANTRSKLFFDGYDYASTMSGLKMVSGAFASESLRVQDSAYSAISDGSGLNEKTEPDKLLPKMAYAIKTTVIQNLNDFGALANNTANEGQTQLPTDNQFAIEPMILLSNLGSAFLGLASLMLAAIAASGAISYGVGSSVVTGTFGGGAMIGLFQAMLEFGSPMVWGMVLAGVAMTFISLIPVVVGIFASISLMVQLLQGIAIAPFAAILLATPEGEGAVTQTFKQFIMHFFTLAVTALIIVLASVAGIMIEKVGGNMIINTFVTGMNFYGADSPWIILGSIFIFIWLMYKLVMKCSHFMLTWPDEVTRALGGGFFNPLGGSSADEFMGASSKIQDTTVNALDNTRKAVEKLHASKAKPKGEEE